MSINQPSSHPMVNGFQRPPRVDGKNRGAAVHRLERHNAKVLPRRRVKQDRAVCQQPHLCGYCDSFDFFHQFYQWKSTFSPSDMDRRKATLEPIPNSSANCINSPQCSTFSFTLGGSLDSTDSLQTNLLSQPPATTRRPLAPAAAKARMARATFFFLSNLFSERNVTSPGGSSEGLLPSSCKLQ